jgi:prophage tail gpP-like protein
VRGQSSDGTGEQNLQIEATSQDTSLGRHRPVVIIEDGDLDQETAQTRADTRRDREAGESLKASGEVQGFRDSAGTISTPGFLIRTESPFLNLAKLLLIKKVSFNQKKPGGSKTRFGLIDPRAFGGSAGMGGSSVDVWNIEED